MPNDKRPVLYDENLNFFRNLILQARLVWLLIRDPRVPLWVKTLPVGSLAYLFMPVDVLPDVALLLGQIDDIVVLALGFRLFIDLCPASVVAEHMESLKGHGPDWQVQQQAKAKEAGAGSETVEAQIIDGSYTEPPAEEK